MILDTDDIREEEIKAKTRVSIHLLEQLHYRVVGYREGPLIVVHVNEVLYAIGNDYTKIQSLERDHNVYIDLDTEFYILEGILFKTFNEEYVFQVNAMHDKHDTRYRSGKK